MQLCAQAMCIEEMLNVCITEGALFYGKIRRRKNITFNHGLRQLTEKTAIRFHKLISGGITPKADFQPKCRNCSMNEICLPAITKGSKSAKRYLSNAVRREIAKENN